MARKKGSKDYPIEMKLEVIRLREEVGLTYKEITERLEIRDPRRASVWMRIYRKEGVEGLKKPRRGRPKVIKTAWKSGSGGWKWRTPF